MNNSLFEKFIHNDFPQFQNTSFRVNEEGWDNLVYIVNEQVIFRIPRHASSRDQLRVEFHFLPQIAAVSPLPVPEYKYFSKEPGLYAGYDLLSGSPLSAQGLESCTKAQQKQIAAQTGSFLSVLHTLPIKEAALKTLPIRRQKRESWCRLRSEVLDKGAAYLAAAHRKKIGDIFTFILDEIDFDHLPKALIHGDFSADHILFDEADKRISGVIDFGDLMIGDPAYDFTGILLEYGRDFMDDVLAQYEPKHDEKFLERIERFYLPKVPLHSLLFGIEQGNEGMISQALDRLVS